jgi:hypothetical protein
MKRSGFGMVSAITLVLLAQACSGEDRRLGGEEPFETSLPGDKPIGSLSDGEAAQLCIDQVNYFAQPALRADMCRMAGALAAGIAFAFAAQPNDAELRATCRSFYDECMNASADVSECGNEKAPPNCSATVSELAACVEDTGGVFDEIAQLMPDCDRLDA